MRYIVNRCKECGGEFEFAAKEIGREWNCPHCNAAIVLRAPRKKPFAIVRFLSNQFGLILFLLFIAGNILVPNLADIISAIALVVLAVVGLPLLLFKRTRFYTGVGVFIWSWLSLFCFVKGCILSVGMIWGKSAAVLLTMAGIVTIVPGAFIAAGTNHEWKIFSTLCINVVITLTAFIGGSLVMAYSEPIKKKSNSDEIQGDPRN